MRALALFAEYRAGDDEEVAVVFHGEPRGDEAARLFFRLNDEGPRGKGPP